MLAVVEALALGQLGSGELSTASPVHPSCLALSQTSFGDCIRSPLFVKGGEGACGRWSLVSLSVVGPQALVC